MNKGIARICCDGPLEFDFGSIPIPVALCKKKRTSCMGLRVLRIESKRLFNGGARRGKRRRSGKDLTIFHPAVTLGNSRIRGGVTGLQLHGALEVPQGSFGL